MPAKMSKSTSQLKGQGNARVGTSDVHPDPERLAGSSGRGHGLRGSWTDLKEARGSQPTGG